MRIGCLWRDEVVGERERAFAVSVVWVTKPLFAFAPWNGPLLWLSWAMLLVAAMTSAVKEATMVLQFMPHSSLGARFLTCELPQKMTFRACVLECGSDLPLSIIPFREQSNPCR